MTLPDMQTLPLFTVSESFLTCITQELVDGTRENVIFNGQDQYMSFLGDRKGTCTNYYHRFSFGTNGERQPFS